MNPGINPDGWLYIALALFSIVIVLAWILMPFAIFGLQGKMGEVARQQRRTNDLLEQLVAQRTKP